MWVNYAVSVGLVLGGIGFGIMAKSLNDIWGWIIMGLGGGLVPGLMMFYWWRFSGATR